MVFKRRQKATARTQRGRRRRREPRWLRAVGPFLSTHQWRGKKLKNHQNHKLRKGKLKCAKLTAVYIFLPPREKRVVFWGSVGGGSARRRRGTSQRSAVVAAEELLSQQDEKEAEFYLGGSYKDSFSCQHGAETKLRSEELGFESCHGRNNRRTLQTGGIRVLIIFPGRQGRICGLQQEGGHRWIVLSF